MKIHPEGTELFHAVTRTETKKLLVPLLQCCESA